MQFKLRLHHFVLKKVNQLHIIGKKATKPAQIIASLIQGRKHKGKWTSFHLLPDLCPLHFSCCHVKLQTSVGSPLMTQLQAVRVWKCSIWKTKWSERSLSGLRGAYQSLQGPRGWCPHLQSTSPVCALCAGLEHWCVGQGEGLGRVTSVISYCGQSWSQNEAWCRQAWPVSDTFQPVRKFKHELCDFQLILFAGWMFT